MKKQRIVVICPGRGSYTKESLGYLRPYRASMLSFFSTLDEKRAALQLPTITELDEADSFKANVHTKGEHASSLIYACSAADFFSIDRDRYEIVAIAGNSMGWYITLALGGVLKLNAGFSLIQTMGSMMQAGIVGGQVIYSLVNKDWQFDPKRIAEVKRIIDQINESPVAKVYESIYLGGYLVFGANAEGIKVLLKELPKIEDYPFQLINHAAFHTPILQDVSHRAFQEIPLQWFEKPRVPLIDGRGKIWQPYATVSEELYRYTLGHQVIEPYDFTTSITVALKEFMPDRIVLLGPGNSLGGAIGQILIKNDWKNLKTKTDFSELQKRDPFLISMGLKEQARTIQKENIELEPNVLI